MTLVANPVGVAMTNRTDADDFADDQCWNCGGEGYVANCQDEIACMYPEDGCSLCMRRCEYCAPERKVHDQQ